MITRQIKVVKKDEVNKPAAEKLPTVQKKQAARDMVQNVSNWVTEFQQRRRVETSLALKSLFPESPITNRA